MIQSERNRIMPPARGTKTLAWFMDQTGIFEKQEQQQQLMQQQQQQQQQQQTVVGRRNSTSDESKSTTPSAQQQQQFHQQQQLPQHQHQKKQKRYRKTLSQHGAARKEGYVATQAMSESSEDGLNSTILPPPVTLTTTSNGSSSSTTNSLASGIQSANNEEYWFYDVATDGYYYEQNGAKGWRRRQPNAAVHKGAKDQEVAHMNVNGPSKYNQLLAAQAAAAQAAFLQQAAFQMQQQQQQQQAPTTPTPQPNPGQPTMRYYDPNSDGFFYEMASVDGWKRRQPNKPVSASVPNGITRPYSQREMVGGASAPPRGSSYGAALARGQFPRNTVKQQNSTEIVPPESRDSASSSQCGDTFAELFNSSDPFFNPIQRPSALNLEQKAVSPQLENAQNSTAALFDAVLADFNGGFGGVKPTTTTPSNFNTTILPPTSTPSTQSQAPTIPSSQISPMKESWNSFRSCSLFSPIKPSKRVLMSTMAPLSNQQPMGAAMGGTPIIDDMVDDDTMKMLMRDLDKLWANTPVSGLNQA